MLHLVISQVRQFTTFESQLSHHLSHRKASLSATASFTPHENFKSASMRKKLKSLLLPKRTLLSSLIIVHTINSAVLFFQGYVTEKPFSTCIYLSSQLFLFQTLCLCIQKHIYFFNTYVIKQNQPYP